jgi:hypothetical protein
MQTGLDKILYALNTRSVGRFAFTMLMAALLSSYSSVSPVGRNPSSMRMDRKSLVVLAAINDALRHSRVRASDSDVVDLSAQKEDLPVDRTSVDTSLVYGVHDVGGRESC